MKSRKSLIIYICLSVVLFGVRNAYAQVDTEEIDQATCDVVKLLEGDLGGILATVAGIGAVVATAMGAFRSFYTLMGVALSAFIIRAMVALWFPEALGENCSQTTPRSSGSGGSESVDPGNGFPTP